jgi:hypothetical protein
MKADTRSLADQNLEKGLPQDRCFTNICGKNILECSLARE